jgi:hypothetical protein
MALYYLEIAPSGTHKSKLSFLDRFRQSNLHNIRLVNYSLSLNELHKRLFVMNITELVN